MTVDEKIDLARKISEQLAGVALSEWRKWMKFVDLKGLERALQMSESLAKSLSLRSEPKRAHQLIHQVVTRFPTLKKMSQEELLETLGYVAWWLASRRAQEKPSQRQHDRERRGH